MSISIHALCADPTLGLIVRAGERHLDRPVTWAHVSELEDPAAFLSGGELLLTAGVALPADPEAARRWVRRLVVAGVAGVGFGVGLRFDATPDAVLAAAREHQLPLLEVPLAVPFIAVEKAVSRALSTADHSRLQRAHQQQRRLVRAALAGDDGQALVERGAEMIGGWAALLDASGRVRHASQHVDSVALESTAAERASRPREVLFHAIGGADVLSQPLTAADGTPLGHLVAGRRGTLESPHHGVVTMVGSLATLLMRRTAESDAAVAAARAATLGLLLTGAADQARPAAERLWPDLPAAPLRVLVAAGVDATALESAGALAAQVTSPNHPSPDRAGTHATGHAVAIAGESAAAALVERLAALPAARVGVSTPADWPDLARAHGQAVAALAQAEWAGVPAARFGEAAGAGLTDYLDRERAHAFAASHLSVLRGHPGADLVGTLRQWLALNGLADPAARALGIHRHTLRRRLDRAQELLGMDLDSPTVRAELWLELRMVEGDE